MRIPSVLAAGVAGAVLATGGLAAVNLATESAGATQDADAQSGSQFATKAEVQAANTRASAAINMGKRVWNLYGIYGAEPGELIGANSGPIKQLRGVGGGIPGSALSQETQSKINGGGSGGPQGPAGGQGPSGPAGPQGPPGPTSGDAVATDPPDPLPAAQVTLPPQSSPSSRRSPRRFRVAFTSPPTSAASPTVRATALRGTGSLSTACRSNRRSDLSPKRRPRRPSRRLASPTRLSLLASTPSSASSPVFPALLVGREASARPRSRQSCSASDAHNTWRPTPGAVR